jgi:hypothetical protein
MCGSGTAAALKLADTEIYHPSRRRGYRVGRGMRPVGGHAATQAFGQGIQGTMFRVAAERTCLKPSLI